jgi:hypothetical protein
MEDDRRLKTGEKRYKIKGKDKYGKDKDTTRQNRKQEIEARQIQDTRWKMVQGRKQEMDDKRWKKKNKTRDI